MATETRSPPPSNGEAAASQLPGSETITSAKTNETIQPTQQNSSSESFTKSITATVEPMREEQVQNAVKFLSHPKVRGSPVIHRRSFLERKGLTREEIDEAFRRVPDPPSNAAGAEATTSGQDARQLSTTSLQPQVPAAISQHPSVPHGSVPATHTSQKYRFQWYHAILAVGILSASGAGTAVLVKNSILPRFKSWIRKIVREDDDTQKESSKSNPVEEAVEAAKSAASAAAIIAKTSQELLNARIEERNFFEAFKDVLNVQMEQLKSIGSAVHKMESTREVATSNDKQVQQHSMHASGNGFTNRSSHVDQVDPRSSMVSQEGKSSGIQEVHYGPVRPTSAPASEESIGAPYSKSYMEIMAMIQRGETPPGIKEINDMPRNPNQLPTNPRLAPRTKPWGDSQQDQKAGELGFHSQPRSDEYVKTQGFRHLSEINGKPLESYEIPSEQSIKIEELDSEEPKAMSYGLGSSERRGRWVPPQPPKVAIPESAEAIRKPKPAASKQSVKEQTMTSHDILQPVENEQRMTQPEISPSFPAEATAIESHSFAPKQSAEVAISESFNGEGSSGTGAVTSSYHSEIHEDPASVGVN